MLYVSLSRLEALRARGIPAGLRERADALMQEPFLTPEEADAVWDQHGRFYKIAQQMERLAETLGLLHALTGETVYAVHLLDALRHYGRFPRWTGPCNPLRDPPWHSGLETAELVGAYAVAYDFLRDTLTPGDRAELAGAVTRLGIRPLLADWVLPETRVHALDSMGHNWWAVCIARAGVGVLAFRDALPQADVWLPQIVDALRGFADFAGSPLFNKVPNFDEYGVFYESMGYFGFGIGELLRFACAWRCGGGDPAQVTYPQLANLPEAILSFLYPVSPARYALTSDKPAAGARTRYLAADFGDSGLLEPGFLPGLKNLITFWLLCGNERHPLADAMRACLMPEGRYSLTDYFYEGLLRPDPPPPLILPRTDYVSEHVALLRDSWAPDATLLAVRCGSTWNHAHEDAGSFLLFHRGVPLLTDSGCCDYSQPAYRSYYRRAMAHNVVLLDGQPPAGDPVERGGKFVPRLLTRADGADGIRYLLADTAGGNPALAQRAYRHFLWLEPDAFVILDDLHTYRPVAMDWLLHFGDAEASAIPGGIRVSKGDAAATVRLAHPAEIPLSWREGYLTHRPEQPVRYAAFAAEPADTRVFIAAVTLDDAAYTLTPLEDTDALGVRLARDGRVWDVWFNRRADGRRTHENSNHTLGGWDTDAAVLALRRTDEAEDAAVMAAGSYLRRGDRLAHASYGKETHVITLTGG